MAQTIARSSLQSRITTLMIISSVIFISAFTFIQLNNQVANIDRDNYYQANLSSHIVKNNLESIIRLANAENINELLKSSLNQLFETNIIKEAIIFDLQGKIIASTQEIRPDDNLSFRELNKIPELGALKDKTRFFIPEIDKTRQRLDIYLALRTEEQGDVSYIAKISFPIGNIKDALAQVYVFVLYSVAIVIFANMIFGYILSKKVVGPVKVLNEVTKAIAEGDLSIRTNLHTNDELEELGATFNYMTEELIKMKERAENANPLTKLPGNIVIHDEIEKRIKTNQQFMVIYCDLDNFKAFNDKYGIGKGDEAIKITAEVFKEASKTKGGAEDFIGHEGGDDFLLLTTPEKAQGVADYITSEFDKRVRSLYTQEDLTQGFIIAHARDGSVKNFPIMTISLAGVTNAHRTITSYGEVTNIAAEVKKKAKSIDGSVFVIDKRHT